MEEAVRVVPSISVVARTLQIGERRKGRSRSFTTYRGWKRNAARALRATAKYNDRQSRSEA